MSALQDRACRVCPGPAGVLLPLADSRRYWVSPAGWLGSILLCHQLWPKAGQLVIHQAFTALWNRIVGTLQPVLPC